MGLESPVAENTGTSINTLAGSLPAVVHFSRFIQNIMLSYQTYWEHCNTETMAVVP